MKLGSFVGHNLHFAVFVERDGVDYVNTIQPSGHIKDKANATRLNFLEVK